MANTTKTSYLAIAEVANSDAGNFSCQAYPYYTDSFSIRPNVQVVPGKFLPFLPLGLAILLDISVYTEISITYNKFERTIKYTSL